MDLIIDEENISQALVEEFIDDSAIEAFEK